MFQFLEDIKFKYFANRYAISHWFGRTGNNIQQVANALLLAEKNAVTFNQDLNHEIIAKFNYNFGKDGLIVRKRFFSWQPIINCEKKSFLGKNEIGISRDYIFLNLRRICKEYIRPHLMVPEIKPYDEETLVIHLRGGDIFEREYASPVNYVQNPLSFYLKLIPRFKDILIVYEPQNNNPILTELKKISKVKFQSLSVAEDFATLLAAKNLATSGVGTFAIAAALCSVNLNNLFVTNNFLSEHLNHTILYNSDISVNEYKLADYIPVYPCSWKNTPEQRRLMVEYIV